MTRVNGSLADGRTARRDRNRVAVLDAVIELFGEGELHPRPEDVAKRSGVSLRSVYRYFSDPAELLRAAMERHLERVAPLQAVDTIGEGPLGERIDRFVEARLRLYEAIAAVGRAARAAAPRNEVIRERYERTRRMLREQVERHFAPELRAMPARRRRAVTAAVDALVQLESLDYHRVHRGFSSKQTADNLREVLAVLLDY